MCFIVNLRNFSEQSIFAEHLRATTFTVPNLKLLCLLLPIALMPEAKSSVN